MIAGTDPHFGAKDSGKNLKESGFRRIDDGTLVVQSLARGRRLSLMASGLGIGSVVLSLVIVVTSLLQNRQAVRDRYLGRTKTEVRMLATVINLAPNAKEPEADALHGPAMLPAKDAAAIPRSDRVVLQVIWGLWAEGHWYSAPDEHLVVIDNLDSRVLLDSASGAQMPPVATQVMRDTIVAVRERMERQRNYSGPIPGPNGTELVGAFSNLQRSTEGQGRNWLLGVYRDQPKLYADEGLFTTFGALVAVCGLAMPLSLLLMYITYRLAQRDRMRAEEARARLAAIVQSSEDAIFSQSFDGTITSWNSGAAELFGYSESEAIGRISAELIRCSRPDLEQEIVEQIRRGEEPREHSFEVLRECSGGKTIHVSQTVSPVKNARGRHVGVSIIARDITAHKNLERELLEITSREQQRIGRELHDSLGQELTGVSYLAKSLVHKLSAASSPLEEMGQTILSGVQQALREVRRAVQGLVPVEVDASGFMVALEKLAADTQARCGIECRVECSEAVPIDDNVMATHLFRIVQEAINNAVKHSQAKQIVVRPQLQNGTLAVTVEDDGVGIVQKDSGRGGMGLRIMRYRAGVIDATLDVLPAAGKGTAVVCLVKNKRQNGSSA